MFSLFESWINDDIYCYYCLCSPHDYNIKTNNLLENKVLVDLFTSPFIWRFFSKFSSPYSFSPAGAFFNCKTKHLKNKKKGKKLIFLAGYLSRLPHRCRRGCLPNASSYIILVMRKYQSLWVKLNSDFHNLNHRVMR